MLLLLVSICLFCCPLAGAAGPSKHGPHSKELSATIISVSCNNHSYSNATTFYYLMTMSAVVLLRLSFDIFICIFLFILNIVLCDIKAPFSLLFIILIFLAADLSVSCHVFLSRWMGLLCRADTMAYSEEKFFLARHSC